MKKTFRHTGVLMMVGVFALGLLGAAYTLWYEDLTLEATVDTGVLDIDWSCEVPNPDYPDSSDDPSIPGPCDAATMPVVALNGGIDVPESALEFQTAEQLSNIPRVKEKMPECSLEMSDDSTAANGNTGDDNVLVMTLTNLYPYAGCEFWVDVHNSGTVPAHVQLILPVQPNPAVEILPVAGPGQTSGDVLRCIALYEGINTEGGEILDPQTDGAPLQLHAGEEVICHFVIYLTQSDVEDEDPDDVLPNFTFKMAWKWYQWNEVPSID